MPHSLLELNAMDENQLRALADELGIKGTKKMNAEELGFSILDQEAINESKNPQPNEKKKKGRPKKEAQKKAETEAPAQETPAAAEPAQKQPKPKQKQKLMQIYTRHVILSYPKIPALRSGDFFVSLPH